MCYHNTVNHLRELQQIMLKCKLMSKWKNKTEEKEHVYLSKQLALGIELPIFAT